LVECVRCARSISLFPRYTFRGYFRFLIEAPPVPERATNRRCCASLQELRAARHEGDAHSLPMPLPMFSPDRSQGGSWSASQVWCIYREVNVSDVMLLSPIWEIYKNIWFFVDGNGVRRHNHLGY
jgi:hypothetical protein